MPPIELGPLGPLATRSVSAVDARPVKEKSLQGRPVANDAARSHAAANSAVVRTDALNVGPPPVDWKKARRGS